MCARLRGYRWTRHGWSPSHRRRTRPMRRCRSERCHDLSRDRRLDRGRRALHELTHLLQTCEDNLRIDPKLSRQLVNPWLSQVTPPKLSSCVCLRVARPSCSWLRASSSSRWRVAERSDFGARRRTRTPIRTAGTIVHRWRIVFALGAPLAPLDRPCLRLGLGAPLAVYLCSALPHRIVIAEVFGFCEVSRLKGELELGKRRAPGVCHGHPLESGGPTLPRGADIASGVADAYALRDAIDRT